MTRTFYTDPQGVAHEVVVEERRKRTATINYLDNARRGVTWHRGRKFNHASRVRVIVNLSELREVNQ